MGWPMTALTGLVLGEWVDMTLEVRCETRIRVVDQQKQLHDHHRHHERSSSSVMYFEYLNISTGYGMMLVGG